MQVSQDNTRQANNNSAPESQGAFPFCPSPKLPDICRNNHGGNEESEEANRAVHPSKETVRLAILAYAEKLGGIGIIADEVARFWGVSHNHVAPRISELKSDGRLVKVPGLRRRTRAGCSAQVLVLPQYLNPNVRLTHAD